MQRSAFTRRTAWLALSRWGRPPGSQAETDRTGCSRSSSGADRRASDLDAAAQLDDTIGRQAEEVAGIGGDARQHQEQLLLPARQDRPGGLDEAVAADEVGGAHR